jgi:hypothetical protein
VGRWKAKEKVKESEYVWMYFVFLYENKRKKPAEIVLGMGDEGE